MGVNLSVSLSEEKKLGSSKIKCWTLEEENRRYTNSRWCHWNFPLT